MSLTSNVPSTTFVAADYSTGSNFMGWYIGQTPIPVTCPIPQYYITSGYYAGCSQPSSETAMPTGCSGATLLYDNPDFDGVCDSSYSCSSFTIFPTEHAGPSSALWAFSCLNNWNYNSLYRTLPTEYDSSTITSASSNTAATPTSTLTTDITTSNTATPQPTNSSSGSGSSSSGLSGGAIAGIVVGCAAAVLIALLVIFRKKIMACFGRDKPPAIDDGPAWSPVYVPPQTQSMAYTESTMISPSEMSSEHNAIHEIGSSNPSSTQRNTIHELG